MTAPMRLTAGAPLPVLVDALAVAHWGVLQGRTYQGVRPVLQALASMLKPRTGTGWVTADQIGGVASRCQRTVRDVLHWLEDLGLIQYTRGQIFEGTPKPGFIRVNKSVLVDLIRLARPAKDQATEDRNARTRARIAALGKPTFKNKPQRFRSSHRTEMNTGFHPLQGEEGSAPARSHSSTPLPKGQSVNPQEYEPWLPSRCHHTPMNPHDCNACLAMAIKAKKTERNRQTGDDEVNQALMREYAAAMYPHRPFSEVYKYVVAEWKGGDIDRWKAEQGAQSGLFEVANG